MTVNAYASSFLITGDYSEGLPLIEELRDLAAKIWKEDRTVEIMIRTQLVMLYRFAGDTASAESELEELIAARRASDSKPHLMTFQFGQGILNAFDDWFEEHPEDGRFFAKRIAQDARMVTQPGTQPRADALALAGRWLNTSGEHGDAADILGEAVAAYRICDSKNENQREEMERSLASALAYYAESLIASGRAGMGESAARECIAIRERALDAQDQWLTTNARSLLGAALAGQGRFEEAEAILLDADRALRSSILVPAENQRKARERIVALYEAWGKPERADEFREGAGVGSEPESGAGASS
jgi:serine/threonine-protein kinase